MCGFLAQFGPQAALAAPAVSDQLASALAHRGRDDFQTLSGSAYRIWSWRLALVDPLASQQPLRSSDGRVAVLLNGEIYNYRDLRSQLQQEGASFRTQGDTEVVLEAYRRWGPSCFQSFEGMFAICIVDDQKGEILLARDPLGIKPLYYAQKENALWVASEPKALFAAGAASPALDREALPSYLLFQTVLGTRTLFRSIQKVAPGRFLRFHLRTLARIGDGSLLPRPMPSPKHEEESRALAREILLESARKTFDTDLPLAFHLSGGLDSNLLVSLFRHLHPGREFVCLSSLIEGESDAEWAYIREFAALHGGKMEKTVVNSKVFFDSLDEVIYYLDEPAGDPGVIPQFHVNKLCALRGKIVLAGHGLDEMFFGYIRNLAAAVGSERGVGALDARGREFAALPADTRAFFQGWEEYLQPMSDSNGRSMAQTYFRKLCRWDPFAPSAGTEKLSEDLRRQALETCEALEREAPSLGDFMLAAETRIQLPALLQMEDRASMRYTVEARVPFCNPSVMALAQAIPLSWKLRNGVPKGLLRAAFEDLLPPSVLSRREKVGRPIPLSRWLEEPAGRPFRQQLETNRELFRDLTSCDLVQQARDTRRPHDRLLWGLLSLSRWMDLYRVSV